MSKVFNAKFLGGLILGSGLTLWTSFNGIGSGTVFAMEHKDETLDFLDFSLFFNLMKKIDASNDSSGISFFWSKSNSYDDEYLKNLDLIDLLRMCKFARSGLKSNGREERISARNLVKKIKSTLKSKDLMKEKVRCYSTRLVKDFNLLERYDWVIVCDCMSACEIYGLDKSLISELDELRELGVTIYTINLRYEQQYLPRMKCGEQVFTKNKKVSQDLLVGLVESFTKLIKWGPTILRLNEKIIPELLERFVIALKLDSFYLEDPAKEVINSIVPIIEKHKDDKEFLKKFLDFLYCRKDEINKLLLDSVKPDGRLNDKVRKEMLDSVLNQNFV